MFAIKQFFLYKSRLNGIKTLPGIFLSLIFLTLTLLIFIKAFEAYNKFEPLRTQAIVNEKEFNQEIRNLTLTMTFPKEFSKYGRWIDYEGNIRSLSNIFTECNSKDFERFFPNITKNESTFYYCLEIEMPSIAYMWYYFEGCSTINNINNLRYRRARDPTCNQNFNKDIWNSNIGLFSAHLHFMFYDEAQNNYYYRKDVFMEKDYYSSISVRHNKYTVNNRAFYNNIENFNSIELFGLSRYKFSNTTPEYYLGFDINFRRNFQTELEFYKISIVKQKVSILISFVISITTILYWILYCINKVYSEYRYKRQILEDECEEGKSVNDIRLSKYIFLQCLKSYFFKNEEFEQIDKIIVDSVSIDKKIVTNKNSNEYEKSEDKENISFLMKIDFLTNVNFLKLGKKANFKSRLSMFLYIFMMIFLIFLIIVLAHNNFHPSVNPIRNELSNFQDYQFEEGVNKSLFQMARLRISRLVFEYFKLVKYNIDYSKDNKISKINYNECSQEELRNFFKRENIEEDEKYINICISFKDFIGNNYNTKALFAYIFLFKCADIPSLYQLNECKDFKDFDTNQNIDIEVELTSPNQPNSLKKAQIKWVDGRNRGYFQSYITLTTEKNSLLFKKNTFFKVDMNCYRYSSIHFDVLLNNLALSAWEIIINPQHLITESGGQNLLMYLNNIMTYFEIVYLIIAYSLYIPLEYFYINYVLSNEDKKEINENNNQSNNDFKIIQKIIVDNNNSRSNLHSINKINQLPACNDNISKINKDISQDDVIKINKNNEFIKNNNSQININANIDFNRIEISNVEFKPNKEITLGDFTIFNYLRFKLNMMNEPLKCYFSNILSKIDMSTIFKLKKNEINTNVIYSLDILSEKSNLVFFRGKSNIKSKLGGFLSLVILLFTIPIIYLINIDYWKHKNPIIYLSSANTNLKIQDEMSKILTNYNITFELNGNAKDRLDGLHYIDWNSQQIVKTFNFTKNNEDSYLAYESILQNQNGTEDNHNYIALGDKKFFGDTSKELRYGVKVSYMNYILNDLKAGKSLQEINYNITSNEVRDFPYYALFLSSVWLLDNTGNIIDMDQYENYYYIKLSRKELFRNGQVLLDKNGFEFHFRVNLNKEIQILHYKTISTVVIDSFTFISIMTILFQIISSTYGNYLYLKYLDEIFFEKASEEITLKNVIFDELGIFKNEDFSFKKDILFEKVSLENLRYE